MDARKEKIINEKNFKIILLLNYIIFNCFCFVIAKKMSRIETAIFVFVCVGSKFTREQRLWEKSS
jgi:hypothetical protein